MAIIYEGHTIAYAIDSAKNIFAENME